MTEDNTPSTPEQHEAIRLIALQRVSGIMALAKELRDCGWGPSEQLICERAADQLEQLVGDGK